MAFTSSSPSTDRLDVVIVGAGFSGLYMLHRLRGLGMTARVIERADGVGGTWYWNRYPGARCDIESLDYCYSFDEDLVRQWRWSERYATQPEILRYLEHVADRFDLRRDIKLGTSVLGADWDESRNAWVLRCDDGKTVTATYCVMATGCLSTTKKPDFPGLSSFRGQWFHTGQWPHTPVDFSGKTVAVVGTGSSAIQAIPQIARQADRLYVLQRTPNYSMPAQNRLLEEEEVREVLRRFHERRRLCEESESGVPLAPPTLATSEVPPEQRRARYEEGWQRGGISALSFAFTDFFTDEEANRQAQDFARAKVRQIVRDQEVAGLLCPMHDIGTKRTCTDIGYFETYNRENVGLVDVRDNPIQEITPTGIRLSGGTIDVEAIVFAIGFDAMTGALTEIAIRGVDGQHLQDKWKQGPLTLLGLQSAGFPNLFMITGPGSPSVLSNMVVSIEQHVDWVTDCLAYLRDHGLDRIEATAEAVEQWMRHVAELAAGTLYPRANSWYVGANIPGKPRVFMPYVAGCGQYRRECDDIANRGYAGFSLGKNERIRRAEVHA